MSAIEIRMLVVDDDEDMRATLIDFISKMGVKVRQAANLEEARRFLGNDADPYDIVITDLRLPDGNGLEVVRAAHSRRPDTLVTIVTGYASLDTAIEAIRLGAYDYVTKPFTLDQIGVQVRNMVQRILLSKENARLSVRLQELYQEVNRLQSEKVEAVGFHNEIRRQLLEIHRKLDRLTASSVTDALAAEMPSQNSRPPVARFLLGLDDSSDARAGADRS
jgi:DNA-binding NtrC family response regulator